MAGIDRPDGGVVEVDGVDLGSLDEEGRTRFRRDRIGFVFQFFNLVPTLTVEENVLLPLELKEGSAPPSAPARAGCSTRSASPRAPRPSPTASPAASSSAWRSPVRSPMRPALLLADEPTGNLDLETGLEVLELLDWLTRRAGKTLVMVTHSREVMGIADRLLAIEEGRLVERTVGGGPGAADPMTLRGRASARFFTRHPWQLGLSLLGIALGVAGVVAVDLANESARRAFQLSTAATAGSATHAVTAGSAGVPEELVRLLRVDLAVDAAPVVEALAALPDRPGEVARILGIDPLVDLPFRDFLGARSAVDLTRLLAEPGSVLLSTGTAARWGVTPGDRLALRLGTRRVEAVVLGSSHPATRAAPPWPISCSPISPPRRSSPGARAVSPASTCGWPRARRADARPPASPQGCRRVWSSRRAPRVPPRSSR